MREIFNFLNFEKKRKKNLEASKLYNFGKLIILFKINFELSIVELSIVELGDGNISENN